MQGKRIQKLLTVATVLIVAVTISQTVARAQSSITLGASADTIVFSASGSSGVLDLNIGTLCPNSGKFCAASGMGDSGYFLIDSSSSIQLSETPTGWSLSESGPLTFEFCSNAGCKWGGSKHSPKNTVFLSGSLELTNLVQLPGSQGAYAYLLVATLNDLQGPLASEFKSGDGQLDLRIQLSEDLSSLLPGSAASTLSGGGHKHNQRLLAPVSNGSLVPDPTPEPRSIFLFGTGLLALGVILKRRFGTARA